MTRGWADAIILLLIVIAVVSAVFALRTIWEGRVW